MVLVADRTTESTIKIVTILTLILLIFTKVSGLNASCSGQIGLAILPGEECNSYIICYLTIFIREGWCMEGTGYDPRYRQCTWQFYIQCKKNELIQKKQKDGVFVCPGRVKEAFYPNFTSGCPAKEYIHCQTGISTNMVCPAGMYFNDGTGACDVIGRISCGFENPQCPQTLNFGSFADYKSGCPPNKYYICFGYYDTVNKRYISLKSETFCPEGLYYNEGIKTCDFIQNIPCQQNIKY